MNLFEHIKNILKDVDGFSDGNDILKNKVVEAALKLDPKLLAILIKDEKSKSVFFEEVEGILIFDKIKFQKFVSNKEFLPDSFTAFKNKIGLTANGEYLTEAKEVVLDFPYKDCVLEGGQTKEDQKRQEIFWNETLARDEIDRLFEPKVFTNWKKYDKDGEHDVDKISMDDNFIIKGNNLIAMHSLKKRFRNKIDFIYIDPPYNTGADSFGYNDNFNHSSWLTFMKNRLDIAKHLLSPTGVILVQCSFHEFAFLKILMLEIFPKHLIDFHIQVRHPDRSLTGDKEYNDVIEYIIVCTNDKYGKMPIVEKEKTVDDYNLDVLIKENEFPVETLSLDGKQVEVYLPSQYSIIKSEANKNLLKKITIRGSIREKNSSGRFFVKNLEILNQFPPETLFKVPDMGDDNREYRYFYSAPENRKNGGYFQGMPTSSSITKKQYTNFYNFEKEYNNVSKQGGVSFRNGKKPEELIKFLMEIFTTEDSLILDYHLGSGTTCAVAHKMSRQYIGIEQMDYIKNLSVPRLENVINGEQNGISSMLDWSGGGDFIYCELAENKDFLLDKILNSNSVEEFEKLYLKVISTNSFLYNLSSEKLQNSIKDFSSLCIDDMRKTMISILEINSIYIEYSEIMDSDYDIHSKIVKLNNNFYE